MALSSTIRELLRITEAMFSKRKDIDSLWQEIAYNFYPERAFFTSERHWGEEYADHLFASYPVLARRELGNMFSANLRPQSNRWFSIHAQDEELDRYPAARRYLEHITEIQWRATYDRKANFVKACRQTDHDFATFGNGILHVGPNAQNDGLLFRNYHLKDCTWSENGNGQVDCLYRKWEPTAKQLVELFPQTVHGKVREAAQKEPERCFKCVHLVVPSHIYAYKGRGGREFPYASLTVDQENEVLLEETGSMYFPYVVPRWWVVSGSVYGRSMATEIALPDSRTLQVVMRTLREAGEKFTDPPLIAVAEAIRGDVATYPGGITTVDMEYDERLGEVLRPISQDRQGMPIGFEIAQALKEDIRLAFALDKLMLPETNKEMTAFEIKRRLEEHIRAASPLFEPIEHEYNAPLCEAIFDVLRLHSAFPLEQMPPELSGADIKFDFRSPLSDMADRAEAETYLDVMTRVWAPAAAIDPAQWKQVDLTGATRAAAKALGWKEKHLLDPAGVEAEQKRIQRQEQMALGLGALGGVGEVAEQGSKALGTLRQAVQ